MRDGGSIELEGVDALVRSLRKCDREVQKAALEGLEAGAQNIIADAQVNLRNNGSVVSGLLRQSGHVIRKGGDITAGFFDTTNRNSGYAAFVEYGRRAGRMPPVDDIAAWVYKKFHIRDWKEAMSMAWAMAKRIAKQGTTPHPFFGPAVEKNYKSILNAVRDAVRKKTR